MSEQTIQQQVREWSDKPTDSDLSKFADDDFDIGCRVCWVFKDDLDHWNRCGEDVQPKDFPSRAYYSGIVVPLEDTETHRSLDSFAMLNDAFVCMTEYPVEKCYPDAAWIPVGQLISNPDLVWFGREEVKR